MTGTITITWASSIENHKGMEVIGDIGGTGHTLAHLTKCMEKFEEKKISSHKLGFEQIIDPKIKILNENI